MTSHDLQKDEKGGVNPLAAAVTGAVVGAGVAIAGVMALKDEKNRKKVQDALTNAKVQAKGYIDTVQKETEEKKAEIKEKVTKELDK